jgi:hypothetical protein
LDWKNDVKVVIHFADAPCHGIKYNGGKCGDSYPNGVSSYDI